MSDPVSEDEAVAACECKLGETAWKYDRMELLAEVGNKWATSPDDGGISTSSLQRDYNREIIKSAAREADMTLLDGEAENFRRLLRAEKGVDTASKTEAMQRLTDGGVDAKSLENSLVGETTVHQHLTKCLGLEYNRPTPTQESSIAKIQQAKRQYEGNVEDALRQQNLEAETSRISVSTNVVCKHCESIYDAGAFISDNGCDCLD